MGTPWSLLASTSNAGSSQITLQDEVTWQVGDEIVIASTGLEDTAENEQKTITAVAASGGQTVITLDVSSRNSQPFLNLKLLLVVFVRQLFDRWLHRLFNLIVCHF